jgi:uncharacterized repeat protein (TIGR01451 family)
VATKRWILCIFTILSSLTVLARGDNPVPVLQQLSSTAGPGGSPTFALQLYGSNFVSNSVVRWNGHNRVTTYGGPNQLTATILQADLLSIGDNLVTVFNPAPGGGESAPQPFTTFVSLMANDLVYNPRQQLLYASVPSIVGPAIGNSVVPIDPATGIIGNPIFVGSEPNKLALSSDDSVLWVGLDGGAAVRKVNLVTHTAGVSFSLGGGTGFYNPPYTAKALAVMPGNPDTLAVCDSVGEVAIYDDGVARPAEIASPSGALNGMAFSPSGATLYGVGSGYGSFTVDSTGVTSATLLNSSETSNDLRYDNGRVYLTNGAVLDASTGVQLGAFYVNDQQQASGPVAPDSTVGRAYLLYSPGGGSTRQINAYDLTTFVLKGSEPIGEVNTGYSSTAASLVRWGSDGLAYIDTANFTQRGQLYILHSKLVRDLSKKPADLSISAQAPATAVTGSTLTYNLTVTNGGPYAAPEVVVIDTLPSDTVLQSVNASQGSCSGTDVIRCDLGTLAITASATVTMNVIPLTARTLKNVAQVSSPQGDPNLKNNKVTSTTVVSGSEYYAVPSLTASSPSFVMASSGDFTLTVNGSEFTPQSKVRWNGSALTTSYVNANQLTATVPNSRISAIGWGWISVSNPMPGGGTSSNLALTVFREINLDMNHLLYDPFTRKIYATIPSTATQVTGNSIVAIDPATGQLASPINMGSEPNRLAESDDGVFLYAGIDGALSLRRLNLITGARSVLYELKISGGASTARDIAVMSQHHNSLAVDLGSSNGIGLFDISGNTGTMRPNLTGPYTGSSLAFGSASTVYSYDIDTSYAAFYRWNVTDSGLTQIDGTTLNGLGRFNGGFKLNGGLVYGVGGGFANPKTTTPEQLGQYQVALEGGFEGAISGVSVAPDASIDGVFSLGTNYAGTEYLVLAAYDQTRFVMDGFTPFTYLTGNDLVRWGQDGLAFLVPPQNIPGTGRLVLLRGPFVLPNLANQNPVPTLISSSPASVAHGGGNFYLTVTGTSFVQGAAVLWNGAHRTSTYVSATKVRVAIPAADIVKAGTVNLTAVNPGTAASNVIVFTIN